MPDAPDDTAQQTAIEQAKPFLQAGHHIPAPPGLLAHGKEHIDERSQRHGKQAGLQHVADIGYPQLAFQSLGVHLAAVSRHQPAARNVQPMREHGKIEHRCQRSEHCRAKPGGQPIAALALHLPADASGLMQIDFFRRKHGRQRAEHAHGQQRTVYRSIALKELHACIHLTQPGQTECR